MNRTITEMNKLHLNDVTIKEFCTVHNGSSVAFRYTKRHIVNLKHKNGRQVRTERKQAMLKVLEVLYAFLNLDKSSDRYGDCSPSMRTIAYAVNPSLERIRKTDTKEEIRHKEKALAPTLMYVQRAIHSLKEFGIIKIHEYRAETNQDKLHNSNFYYEFVKVSSICKGFMKELRDCIAAFNAMIQSIRKVFTTEDVDDVEELFRENYKSQNKIYCTS